MAPSVSVAVVFAVVSASFSPNSVSLGWLHHGILHNTGKPSRPLDQKVWRAKSPEGSFLVAPIVLLTSSQALVDALVSRRSKIRADGAVVTV